MTPAPLVRFMIIGAQKAGTTALFDYLSDDPAYNLSDVKEVHFFDDEGRDWRVPDYGPYQTHFAAEGPELRGEATPIYAYWPESLERISAYNPKVKLVFMLRDPVARAWSHWRMETGRGVETHDFGWCIRKGRQRLFDAKPWGHHREFSYVERGFYADQLARVFALFPRDQVLVLRAEDLLADPGAVLGQLNGFLGAPPPPPVVARKVHVGEEMEGLEAADVAWLRAVYQADQARLKALVGFDYAEAPVP